MTEDKPQAPGEPFAVVELEEELEVGGETWTKLEFPRPTAGILKATAANGDYGAVLEVVSEWTGAPRKVVERLGPDSGGRAAELVNRALEPMQEVLGDADALRERIELPHTLELEEPVQLGSRTVESLTCRQALAGYMIGIPEQGATVGHFLKLAAKLFGEPPSTIHRLSPRDGARALRVALHFFGRFQGA